jgi:glycosyltransferase involved in cell wall biosynthesis
MNGPSLVSVVIPCFNQARYLAESLGSVHRQDWPSVESIVVDDGSTDGTSDVAQRLDASIVVRQENRGLSGARNSGLAAARGQYVLFLDADDALFPDAVRTGVVALEADPGAGCVARQCRIMDNAGRAVVSTPPVLRTGDLYEELLRINFVWTPGAVMFRREAIALIGGFPMHHPAAADYAVLLSFARRGLLLFDARDAVWYRKHERNMSHDAILMLSAALAVLERERPLVPARYWPAFLNGQRYWREFYGEQLTMELRREWRTSRRPSMLLTGVLFLWRRCPRQAARHFLRKISRLVRSLPATDLELHPSHGSHEPMSDDLNDLKRSNRTPCVTASSAEQGPDSFSS